MFSEANPNRPLVSILERGMEREISEATRENIAWDMCDVSTAKFATFLFRLSMEGLCMSTADSYPPRGD